MLLERRVPCCERELEVGDHARLAPPARRLPAGFVVSGQLDDGPLRLWPAADDRDRADDGGEAETSRVENAGKAAHGEVRNGCHCCTDPGDASCRERACREVLHCRRPPWITAASS